MLQGKKDKKGKKGTKGGGSEEDGDADDSVEPHRRFKAAPSFFRFFLHVGGISQSNRQAKVSRVFEWVVSHAL